MKNILKLFLILALPVSLVYAADLTVGTGTESGTAYNKVYKDLGSSNYAPLYAIEQVFDYAHVVSTSTQIKSGAGFLHTITVSSAPAQAWQVRDGTSSGAVVISSFTASASQVTYTFDTKFSTGLRIELGVAAGGYDMTVSYR